MDHMTSEPSPRGPTWDTEVIRILIFPYDINLPPFQCRNHGCNNRVRTSVESSTWCICDTDRYDTRCHGRCTANLVCGESKVKKVRDKPVFTSGLPQVRKGMDGGNSVAIKLTWSSRQDDVQEIRKARKLATCRRDKPTRIRTVGRVGAHIVTSVEIKSWNYEVEEPDWLKDSRFWVDCNSSLDHVVVRELFLEIVKVGIKDMMAFATKRRR
jgi:hypothetical protein